MSNAVRDVGRRFLFILEVGRFTVDRRGVTALEYALMGAFIASVIAGALSNIGPKLNSIFILIAGML